MQILFCHLTIIHKLEQETDHSETKILDRSTYQSLFNDSSLGSYI